MLLRNLYVTCAYNPLTDCRPEYDWLNIKKPSKLRQRKRRLHRVIGQAARQFVSADTGHSFICQRHNDHINDARLPIPHGFASGGRGNASVLSDANSL